MKIAPHLPRPAGTDAQTLVNKFKFRHNMYKLREERDMRPKAFAHMVSSMLYEKRFGPFFCEPIIAGLEPDSKPFICGMDSLGAMETSSDFICAGSAPNSLWGMAESMWRPGESHSLRPAFSKRVEGCLPQPSLGMPAPMAHSSFAEMGPEELFEVISQCLLSGVDRDAISGWGAVVHVITKDKVITRTLKGRMD